MIEFRANLINDSESIRNRELSKKGEKYNEESYHRERPYKHSAKANNLARYFAKLQTDLKENFEPFKNIDFNLNIDRDYCEWEGWQLDVYVESYSLADKYRFSIEFDSDPDGDGELDEQDQDDIYDDLKQEAEDLANNGIDEI